MHAIAQNCQLGELSREGRERLLSVRGEPLFIADWSRVLMIHYRVDKEQLQPFVPYKLDLYNDQAFISVVAFTLENMRPFFGGWMTAWLLKPIATHEFLNIRTYVRHGNETGIFFMTEWLSNRLSVSLGPYPFGLPYKYGQLNYRHTWEELALAGEMIDWRDQTVFAYAAHLQNDAKFRLCKPASPDEWLMERYTAFTCRAGKKRLFRVWHPPWDQISAQVTVTQETLLQENWPFFHSAKLHSANFSPGARNVWMGRPHGIH
jgi:uncharacterized protein